ncbi:MAG: LPS export ABC transporter periplasmic protein LptC [Pseudomonadales bacterium]|jgi:lipopolysaccharide export system protein LptC
MNRITFISLLSVVILVLASLVHWQGSEISDPVAQQKQRDSEPDFYMEGAQITQYSETGHVKQQLDAQLVQHFPLGDFTLAEAPQVRLFHTDGTPWNIWADKGRITHQDDTIVLRDNVKLKRTLAGKTQHLNTEKLTLQVAKDLAYTDLPVVITDASTRLNATGMKAFINENRIEFLSNVRVTHDPAKVN